MSPLSLFLHTISCRPQSLSFSICFVISTHVIIKSCYSLLLLSLLFFSFSFSLRADVLTIRYFSIYFVIYFHATVKFLFSYICMPSLSYILCTTITTTHSPENLTSKHVTPARSTLTTSTRVRKLSHSPTTSNDQWFNFLLFFHLGIIYMEANIALSVVCLSSLMIVHAMNVTTSMGYPFLTIGASCVSLFESCFTRDVSHIITSPTCAMIHGEGGLYLMVTDYRAVYRLFIFCLPHAFLLYTP